MKTTSRIAPKSFNVVSVQTREPEKILNLIQRREIGIWDAVYEDGKLRFKCMNSEIDAVGAIVGRFSTSVSVESHLGVQKALDFLMARKVFFALLVAVVSFLVFFSSFVWRVEIYGARNVKEDDLKIFLYENGIRPSTKKKSLDMNSIEVMLLAGFPSLSDAAASLSGSSLMISVVEREGPITIYNKTVPVNLIADRDATVDEIEAYNGTGVVKVKDQVRKGDLLVSGAVKYTYKGTTSYSVVHAMGKVLTYEEISFVCALDMYIPKEDVPFMSQKVYYAFGKSYSTTNGVVDGSEVMSVEKKNNVLSIAWIQTPILYDEIRWYNVENCRTKNQEEIHSEIFELAKSKITQKQTIRSVSFQPTVTEDNRIFYTVIVSVATNIAIEEEIR